MTTYEFTQLRRFELNRRRFSQFKTKTISRSSAKHPSVGQVYKDSRIVSEVGLDTVFNHPAWKHRAGNKPS